MYALCVLTDVACGERSNVVSLIDSDSSDEDEENIHRGEMAHGSNPGEWFLQCKCILSKFMILK